MSIGLGGMAGEGGDTRSDLIDGPVNARDYISEVVKKMLHTAE